MKQKNHAADALILGHEGGKHLAPTSKPQSRSQRRRAAKEFRKIASALASDPIYNDNPVLCQLTPGERAQLYLLHISEQDFSFTARHITVTAIGDLLLCQASGEVAA